MSVTVVFGSPGAGKTTLAVKNIVKSRKKISYSNIPDLTFKNHVPISDSDVRLLGRWSPPRGSTLHVDEASIIFNNRHWKTFPKALIKYMKLIRHYGVDAYFYSQSWDDLDVTISRLATSLWYIRALGPFTMSVKVIKTVMIDEKTHQIVDGYSITKPLWVLLKPFKLIGLHFVFPQIDFVKFTFRPFYYRYFNSFDCDPLPSDPRDVDPDEKGSD